MSLSSPGQLWRAAIEQLSRTFRMDEVAKRVELLTCMSAYTRNPINLFLEGPSSSGKTWGIMETVKLFPQKDVLVLGGMSRKTLQYDYTTISPEGERKATLWDKIIVFLEAPDRETFMNIRPLLSHDSEEIAYKTVVKTKRKKTKHGGRGSPEKTGTGTEATGTEAPETLTTMIEGWPATVFCTSSPPYIQDLRTRGITLSPERSEAKRKAANVLTGEVAARPWSYGDVPEYKLVKDEITRVVEYLKPDRVRVLVPYGKELAEAYPSSLDRDMRDFKRYLSMIKARAAWEILNRPVITRVEPKKKTRLLVST